MTGQFAELSESAVASAACGVDASLDEAEGLCVLGDDLALAVGVGDGAEALVILVIPEGSFRGIEAAKGPFAADEVVHEAAGLGGGGLIVGVIFAGELLEVGGVFAGDDDGLGVEAGFEGVHRGGGLARDGGGAGGFLGVATVGGELLFRRHMRGLPIP